MIFSNTSLRKHLGCWLALGVLIFLTSCGGGSGGSSSNNPLPSASLTNPATASQINNIATITIGKGVTGNINIPMVSVTVCIPGSTHCQTIDNILVDTGSYGLRIFNNQISLTPLQPISVTSPNITGQTIIGPLTECAQFADGFTYGPVVRLDVQISDELASNIPVEIISSSNFQTIPKDCLKTGKNLADPTLFGANGVLGIGNSANDAPSYYYNCADPNKCNFYDITATNNISNVVVNPVTQFKDNKGQFIDNNGVVVSLPPLSPLTGYSNVTGQLIFGINTRSNNVLPSNANVINLDYSNSFTTQFNSQNYSSFVDTGSNALYFNSTLNLTPCNSSWNGFYCLNPNQTFTAQLISTNTYSINFSVGDPSSYQIGTYASDNIAGSTGFSTSLIGNFDWGLPFFFGKKVFIGIASPGYFAYIANQ